jgi:TolB-like protein/DNA-binding winged helix-turn-helix (wHTH) protein
MKNSESFASDEPAASKDDRLFRARTLRLALAKGDLGKERESSVADGYVYRFGQFALDSRKRTLARADSPIALTAKAFDVLLFLAQNPNRLVTKEELLKAVWGDTFVEEGNLTQYISLLRKALGGAPEDARLIVTIARKGYQFTADVTVARAADSATQDARHVSSDDKSPADTQRDREVAADEAVPEAPRHWQKAALVGASAVLLAIVSVASWRYFGSVTPPSSQTIMLAVLPFENLTGDPTKEYLADGLTEETISQLGRLDPERLGVIARTSVMGYKHTAERLDQIGRDLSVQFVLENSLRKSGDQIRITSQLLRVKDQSRLWSQDFDYRAQDVLTVQEQVGRAVAGEIQLRLTAQREAELARSQPVNPEAFDAYLQGYYFFQKNNDKDTNMAARYFERATQLDPSYALAWVGLSRTRHWQAVQGLIPSAEGQRLAREALERALSLNPNLAAAHAEVVRLKLFVDFDVAGADAAAKRLMALEPGAPASLRMAASATKLLGRFDEALQLSRRAVDLDPLNAESWENLAETRFYLGRLDEAAADAKKALELNPDVWPGHFLLSKIYLVQGRPGDALPEIERIRYDSQRAFMYAMAYHAIGRQQESDTAMSELIANDHARSPYSVATVYAFGNRSDEAFEWLDRAYAQRAGDVVGTGIDPLLKNLRDDPRYAAFLKKIRLSN